MITPYEATNEITVLPKFLDVTGYGSLTVNGFVLKSTDPILVDTGTTLASDEFMAALETVIDPQDLKWVWMTHTDADHIGSLHRLLKLVPHLKVITNYVGMAKMSTFAPLPLDRIHLLNPGQRLNLGDRTIIAHKPPLYDAPETTGFLDEKSGAYFAADCFGGVVPEQVEDANELGASTLRESMILWASIDTPWIHKTDRSRLVAGLQSVRDLNPSIVLSGHLAAAPNMIDKLIDVVLEAPSGTPFVGPDQKTLSALLGSITGS